MTAAPTRTWLVLVALTLTAMWAGGVTGSAPTLGIVSIAIVIAVSGFKVVAILRHFLELKRASSGWQTLFYVYLIVLGGLIFAAYAVDWRSLA
jgi:uncharacterized membrane-anchored protein